MNSLKNCEKSKISSLVKLQPTPVFFFKAFFELNMKCFISNINIASDSKSIAFLLDKDHESYFTKEFPIFYRNPDGSSIFDSALRKRQMSSLKLMLDYMVVY